MEIAGIASGSQTGADRTALDFAIRNVLPHQGWRPGVGKSRTHGGRIRVPIVPGYGAVAEEVLAGLMESANSEHGQVRRFSSLSCQ